MTPKKGKDESMFKSLLNQARSKDEQPEEELPIQPAPIEPLPEAIEPRKVGRPRGRRSNPDFTQISALIPYDLLLEIQTELLKEKKEKRQRQGELNLSSLIESLLNEWLSKRKKED
ncbi:hypothetical protein NDI44_27105 [Trichocoleus sp. DQ-A3]|uniref:hypothetical protein n=1 Tax=Cyanophyceae TaxID=3028117 RepID=UPI0016869FD2|nr:hypothetical protein [Coleofasciculus sp. FACHB-125]MBD1903856.1 hypothetical protein [Coleofasciculus sp. FACHB-125]